MILELRFDRVLFFILYRSHTTLHTIKYTRKVIAIHTYLQLTLQIKKNTLYLQKVN